jgi:hypothetical protein
VYPAPKRVASDMEDAVNMVVVGRPGVSSRDPLPTSLATRAPNKSQPTRCAAHELLSSQAPLNPARSPEAGH